MRNGIIWMLHRVAPAHPENLIYGLDSSLRISPDHLAIQIIRAKEKGARFVSIDDFLENKKNGASRPSDICITIDDGFKDIYEYAFPVFKKYGTPFVFYVSSDFIDNGFKNCLKPAADGMMQMMDVISRRQELTLDGKPVKSASLQEKQQAFSSFWQAFIKRKEAFPAMSGYDIFRALFPEEDLDFDGYKRRFLCTWDELREMAAHPLCTIGSHGVSHQWLSLMNDGQTLEREFSASKQAIEQGTGKEIFHFSYPYGQYNAGVVALARKHFRSAVAIKPPDGTERRFTVSSDDDFALPRISVQENVALPAYLGVSALTPSLTKRERLKRLFRKAFNFERKGRKRILTFCFLKIKFKSGKDAT